MLDLVEFRGHIRNWKEMCEDLGIDKKLGRKEREKLIVTQGFAKYGNDLADKLYGHFAFVLHDAETDTTYAVRDQFGTVPLYYYVTSDGRILASTQIREIMKDEGFMKVFDERQLQHYLTFSYPAGEDTMFSGVKKLMPGHALSHKKGADVEIERYWFPRFEPDDTKNRDHWADKINCTMDEIMGQVKDGGETAASFLSGGVDSGYVLAKSDAARAAGCGYDDSSLDETPYAKQTADALEREFVRRAVTAEEYFDTIPYAMENMELPLGDASAIVFAIGAKSVAGNCDFCYSGEGSDEFFAGYNMYRNAERYGDDLESFYVGNTNLMKEEDKARLLKRYDENIDPMDIVGGYYRELAGLDPLSKMECIDMLVWLDGDIYLNVDKMSRAAGLEVRMPLTDVRMFDIARRIPANDKIDENQNKLAFRQAACSVLPEEIANRPKLGFVVPIRAWIGDERYNAPVVEKLTGKSSQKFFDQAEIARIWNDYHAGNTDLWRQLYTIYTFLVWYDIYFGDEEGIAAIDGDE